VVALSLSGLLKNREMVAVDTPAAAATSSMVSSGVRGAAAALDPGFFKSSSRLRNAADHGGICTAAQGTKFRITL
jgi:hypothetical protein